MDECSVFVLWHVVFGLFVINKTITMAEDRNKQRAEKGELKKPVGRSGRRAGQAPQTTETGGQNNGGQTERVNDQKGKRKKG
jgi:hypothetical protein